MHWTVNNCFFFSEWVTLKLVAFWSSHRHLNDSFFSGDGCQTFTQNRNRFPLRFFALSRVLYLCAHVYVTVISVQNNRHHHQQQRAPTFIITIHFYTMAFHLSDAVALAGSCGLELVQWQQVRICYVWRRLENRGFRKAILEFAQCRSRWWLNTQCGHDHTKSENRDWKIAEKHE